MDLLNIRNMLKKRKPVFLAQDWYKRKRIRRRWRRPRGLQSKMRLQKRGKPAVVSSGWRSPRAVRGLTRQGLQEVIIRTARDLDLLGEGRIGVFHRQVSLRTRLMLITLAEERGLQLDARQVAQARARAADREARKKAMTADTTAGSGKTRTESKDGSAEGEEGAVKEKTAVETGRTDETPDTPAENSPTEKDEKKNAGKDAEKTE